MKNILFLGPPGSGKGTQAKMLADYLNIPTLSSGDMLRDEVDLGSELGKKIKTYMQSGDLVSDEIIILLIKNFLVQKHLNGFILDGFPRNINQAYSLEKMFLEIGKSIDKVFNFEVPDDVLIKRILGRYSCKECGSIYNTYFKPTSRLGICDKCNSDKLECRKDDNEQVLKNRLLVYHKSTFPLIDFYQKKHLLISIEAVKSSHIIFDVLKNSL
jgi:adenylate kinase